MWTRTTAPSLSVTATLTLINAHWQKRGAVRGSQKSPLLNDRTVWCVIRVQQMLILSLWGIVEQRIMGTKDCQCRNIHRHWIYPHDMGCIFITLSLSGNRFISFLNSHSRMAHTFCSDIKKAPDWGMVLTSHSAVFPCCLYNIHLWLCIYSGAHAC